MVLIDAWPHWRTCLPASRWPIEAWPFWVMRACMGFPSFRFRQGAEASSTCRVGGPWVQATLRGDGSVPCPRRARPGSCPTHPPQGRRPCPQHPAQPRWIVPSCPLPDGPAFVIGETSSRQPGQIAPAHRMVCMTRWAVRSTCRTCLPPRRTVVQTSGHSFRRVGGPFRVVGRSFHRAGPSWVALGMETAVIEGST